MPIRANPECAPLISSPIESQADDQLAAIMKDFKRSASDILYKARALNSSYKCDKDSSHHKSDCKVTKYTHK